MIRDSIGYSYNDLTIVPAVVSDVSSRSEVNPFVDEKLPIFTAPMSTVVNMDNIDMWDKNNIKPILPRNINIDFRKKYISDGYWVALSMNEAKELFLDNDLFKTAKICIDVANGHMKTLLDLCKNIKNKYGNNVIIMTGNIANPLSIKAYEEAGIDYVRVSIGSGNGCLTAPQTGVHYPIASLIDECVKQRSAHSSLKIIADGGIKNYGDVIKAIALGADFVMIGSVFASLYESAAEFEGYGPEFKSEDLLRDYLAHKNVYKKFYGMSTKEAQRMIKADNNLKTSEGVHKLVKCTHTMKQWSENMEAYLRSAMSYCNSFTLQEFKNQTLIPNSISEINAVNK